jgi:hypothetical protein
MNAGHAGRRLLYIRARLGTAIEQRLLWKWLDQGQQAEQRRTS